MIRCFIPARSNSKRLPNKNFLEFYNGLSLTDIALKKAIWLKNNRCIDQIILMTDVYYSKGYRDLTDPFVKDNMMSYPFEVFERGPDLVEDHSTTHEGIIEWLKLTKTDWNDDDIFIVLQPTTPLWHPKDLESILKGFLLPPNTICSCTVSGSDLKNIVWVNDKIIGSKFLPREKEEVCIENGAFRIWRTKEYMNNSKLVDVISRLSNINSSIDIDYQWEFDAAKAIAPTFFKGCNYL